MRVNWFRLFKPFRQPQFHAQRHGPVDDGRPFDDSIERGLVYLPRRHRSRRQLADRRLGKRQSKWIDASDDHLAIALLHLN